MKVKLRKAAASLYAQDGTKRAMHQKGCVTDLLTKRVLARCDLDSNYNISQSVKSPSPRSSYKMCETYFVSEVTPFSLLGTVMGRSRTREQSEEAYV